MAGVYLTAVVGSVAFGSVVFSAEGWSICVAVLAGKPLSRWMANTDMGKNEDPNESRGVFVDENTCIGCKMCVWCAPATFRIEEEHGRSRVFGQWLDTEDDIEAAISECCSPIITVCKKKKKVSINYEMCCFCFGGIAWMQHRLVIPLCAASDSCPVSCISWVDKQDLPALEYVMQNEVQRVNVGVMMAGQGGGVEDVFLSTQKFLKQRAER
jgi:ferredoxin